MQREILQHPVLRAALTAVYGGPGSDNRSFEKQINRLNRLLDMFRQSFPGIKIGKGTDSQRLRIFSTPGRTEIGGNHTDHNHGRVLAAAVDLDAVALVVPCHGNTITIYSQGYDPVFRVELGGRKAALQPRPEERRTTNALVRGIVARFRESGYAAGGFCAYISSDVLPGSGLSSSAVIEVLIGTILNSLYNGGRIPAQTLAKIGQYAENEYFDKPCGLMDQTACAVGGIAAIDFEDPQQPIIDQVDFDLDREDFRILVVDTGGSHAGLTEDYAAIPREMKAVAAALGKTVCRQISEQELLKNIKKLRTGVGDRAILRALHFLAENRRVTEQVKALKNRDFDRFLVLLQESGESSLRWLQNCFTHREHGEQGITLALNLAEKYIKETGRGACRVHGGGFAGTIQVFLPRLAVPGYIASMEPVFGEGCVKVLSVRSHGSLALL